MLAHSFAWRRAAHDLVLFASLLLVGCENSPADTAPPFMHPEAGVTPPLSPACKNDSECGGKKCDPINGCVECLFDSQCAAGSRCNAEKCELRTKCAASKDCG